MSERANQHFVPQFYFKQFSRGERCIHMLLTAKDRIVLNASVKRQCSRNRFYGPVELESLFSRLDGRHSTCLRRLIEFAWSPSPVQLAPQHIAGIWECILFQRARTLLEVEKHTPATESFLLEMFKEHIKGAPDIDNRKELVEHIESGAVRITEEPRRRVSLQIVTALESVLLISDLDFCILRSQSDYPFIFSDSPVVFCNTYYHNVKNRGVLGLQTPGLQIFFPLDTNTLLMLFDSDVYTGPFRQLTVIDVWEPSDISQLNALQLHHSLNAVYFADACAAEYVSRLWRAHKPTVAQPTTEFHIREGRLIDGEKTDDVRCHGFEPQLNIALDLSFIECSPVDESEYEFRSRSPELAEQHEKEHPDLWDA